MSKQKGKIVEAKGKIFAFSGAKAHLRALVALPDDHECYPLVGLIAAESARIEELLDQEIADLADLQFPVAACLTGQMIGPNPRFTALRQLAVQRGMDESLIKRIKTLSGNAGPIFDKRNRVVHDPWVEDRASKETFQKRTKPRASPDYGFKPVGISDLKAILGELRKFEDKVRELVADLYHAKRGTSPNK